MMESSRNNLKYLLQMVVAKDTPARIAGVYDDHSHSVLISELLNSLEINLPASVWNKIEVAHFEVTGWTTHLIEREPRSRKQDVGAGAGEHRYDDLDCL